MSKYSAGDKFVVKIKEVIPSDRGTLYRTDFSTLVFDDYGLDNLPQLVNGVNEACYNKGLAEAWEAARKIYSNKVEGGLSDADMKAIFGNDWCLWDVLGRTPQEVIAKIKEWEDSKEIRRGDEMAHIMDGNAKMIVTYIAADGDFIHGINRTGDLYSCTDPANWRKTGRNFADKLDALLSEIGG